MSLGDSNGFNGNGRNGENEKYYPEVYSPLVFYNDTAALNFRFALKGILEMKIVPKNENGKGFNNEASIAIYLSPNKAIVLYKALEILREELHNETINNYGCCNNKKTGNVEFGVVKSNGENKLYCSIYKFGNNGSISDNYTFIFDKYEEFIIKNFSPNDLSFDRIPIDDMPILQIQHLLMEYVKGITGGGAYGVEYCVGQYKYNVAGLKKMLLGDSGKGSKSTASANSIFNGGGKPQAQIPQSTNTFTEDDDFDLEF